MIDKLKKIYDDTIAHSSFLDKESVLSCMYQSYILAKQECENESKTPTSESETNDVEND